MSEVFAGNSELDLSARAAFLRVWMARWFIVFGGGVGLVLAGAFLFFAVVQGMYARAACVADKLDGAGAFFLAFGDHQDRDITEDGFECIVDGGDFSSPDAVGFIWMKRFLPGERTPPPSSRRSLRLALRARFSGL